MSQQDVYEASDYAGINAGDVRLYYGYEHTWCSNHGFDASECGDEECDREWSFLAELNGTTVVRYCIKDLGILESDKPVTGLMAGIGKMLEDQHLLAIFDGRSGY